MKDFFFIDRSTFYVMCRWLNLQKMKSNENLKKWTFLPVHVSPSPSNPGRQVHSYEPLMFKQNALSSQGLVEHSSISNEEQIKKIRLYYATAWIEYWRGWLYDLSLPIYLSVYFSRVFNPLHPNISVLVLNTFLYTFSQMPTARFCLIIKTFFSRWLFPSFSWLDASYSQGSSG